MKYRPLLLIIGFLVFLAACAQVTPSPTAEMPDLAFAPKLSMYEAGKVHFELGIANEAGPEQPMVEDANIRAVITDSDGKIRNQMSIVDMPHIPAGETVFPLTYEAVYDPGDYIMSLTGKGVASLSLNFEIREVDGLSRLAAHPKYIDPHTEFTIDNLEQ